MATFDIAICNKALKLLRQDIEITGATGSPVAVKCAALYDLAYDAVATSHDWTATMTGATPTDATLKKLLIYSLAKELSIPITGRQGDFETMSEALNKATVAAIKKDLEGKIANNDPVLAQLVQNFIGKDENLPYTYAIYTNRKAAVMTECENEVKATLGISTLDNLATSAANCLAVAKLGPACGLDANFVQLQMQAYQAKIQEWRKNKLNDALASENDPVLSMLVPNFRSDDAGLVNAFTIYTKRRTSVETGAKSEINNTHGWATDFAKTATTHPAYPAYLYLCALRLAPSVGCSAETLQLIDKQYTEALENAKVKDLETAFAAETDTDLLEAVSLVRQYVIPDGRVPWGWAAIKRKYELVRDGAKKYVLDFHGWSFCRREINVISSVSPDRNYRTAVPADCDRILECKGTHGVLPVILRENGEIVTAEPVFRIEYMAETDGLDDWPIQLRKAYIATIATMLAMSMPTADANNKTASLIQYRDSILSSFRMTDARQNRATYTMAVRDNRYTRAMRGETPWRKHHHD